MATMSGQSAFWAVITLGLNTFVQPDGEVLGFPADYSRALRLSPIACLVDSLGIQLSIVYFYHKTRSFEDSFGLAARYRVLVEESSLEPKLERT